MMKRSKLPDIVTKLDQVQRQIERYAGAAAASPDLQARMAHTHSWYAIEKDTGWVFAPSKFLRREFKSAEDYLAVQSDESTKPDGNRTETRLADWFEVVSEDTRRGREISRQLVEFLNRYGKERRRNDRINVLQQTIGPQAKQATMQSRVTVDPDICGGRPIIRGTRMRVSDILDMLAGGATQAQILEDFDYLTREDIIAAFSYASAEINHRIIRAA